MARSVQLTFRRRIALLALVPTFGLIGIGGLMLAGLFNRTRDLQSDIAHLRGYHAELIEFEELTWRLKLEREAAMLEAADSVAQRPARLAAVFARTDAMLPRLRQRLAELSAATHDDAVLARLKGVVESFDQGLRDLRARMLAGTVSPEALLRAHVKLIFGALAVPESFRGRLRDADSLDYYDAVMAEVKTQQQDMIASSIVLHGLHAGRLPAPLLALMRKQAFAMTESEYYLSLIHI